MFKAAFSVAALVTAGAALALSSQLPVQASTQAARPRVAIWEIYYNSPGSDTGSNASLNHEWVQLHNTTSKSVTMTRWTLRDTAGHVFTFGSFTLKAHAYVKIHTGHGAATQANRYYNHSWYIWNNTGDTATLKTAGGTTEARCRYSDSHERHVLTRCGR
ncbi:MAG TPA: lamin tail domain-containing protein [Streptosporangiaceae bacterium]|jgi:hypothetical protein